MQGAENIIADILKAARHSAAAMINGAEAEAKAEEEELRSELDAARKTAESNADAAADALYKSELKLAELESGRLLLKAKQDCVATVYAAVKKLVLDMPTDKYLAFMQRLIGEYATDGDEIVAGASDKRITAEFVKKLSSSLKRKLTLSKERGDFEAGVILRNAKFDRNLTVDELVADLRERTESDTVKELGL